MSKPRAVYIIGGAGSGKSTLMRSMIDLAGVSLGPCKSLHTEENKAGHRINLYGHEFESDTLGEGVYLGVQSGGR